MLFLVCGIAITAVFGCGGHSSAGSTPPLTTPATTPGNYTFRVIATDASNAKLTDSANLTITVE